MIQQKIKIKPLSVNDCRQGKRFKTKAYKNYCILLSSLMKNTKVKIDKNKRYCLLIQVGLSSMLSDIDNIVKPFQDILSKKYGFNDNTIDLLQVERVKVKKGEEYIEYEFFEKYNFKI